MAFSNRNYLKSYSDSRAMAEAIKDFYKDNPAYPKGFYDRIETWVERNPLTEDYYVRSNLGELFANVVDIERSIAKRA
jgi:hypothetical protein